MKLIYKTILLSFIIVILSACFAIESEGARTSIKVAVNYNFPPFQYLDKNGEIVGLHIDIMNEIADNEDLIVEYIAFNETNKSVEALENGLVDVVLGVVSSNVNNSALQMTNDISSATLCMLVGNENINRVLYPQQYSKKYSAAFQLGTISFSQLSQLNTGNILVLGNQNQLYDSLINKSVDAVIGVKESMVYMLEHNYDRGSYTIVHNYISTVNYSMLTRKNDRVLSYSIDRGISKLRASEKYEQLLDKWITDIELEAALEMKTKLFQYIVGFIFAATAVISIIAYANYKLKKIVDEKTGEINERVKQLENESALRERLFEFLPAGIMMLKEDGTVMTMNSSVRSMAGIEEEESGDTDWNIKDLNILGELYQNITNNEAIVGEGPTIIRLNKNDNRSQIFRCQCQSINTAGDTVMMIEDITEEDERNQEIFELRKSKALNRIIAGMAHEIKNPLMSINTFVSLIGSQGRDEEFQKLFVEHVPKEVERINRLINVLINYTRPMQSKKERVSVREIINDSVYFVRISSKESELINLITNIDLDAYIFVNKDQIRQALVNIIINSIQSVEDKLLDNKGSFPDGLTISVSCYRKNNLIYIEVYDEGCGMTDSEIEKCFDPFFTTKAKGLGMGLALTKQFVNENSGRLHIRSVKNEFTTIQVVFEEDV